MQLPLIDRIRSFIQAEAVLVVAAFAALLSACLFPPTPQNWSAYAEAIDWRTIGLLFCLMTVVAGFTRAGLLARVRSLLTRTEGTQRRLSLLLVTLSFFTAMIVTNDVALISFAPLTLLLFQGSEPRSTIITLVAQTVAANLGSMMTPIGNPQNIYLYSAFELELGEFLTAIAPYGIIGFLPPSPHVCSFPIRRQRSAKPPIPRSIHDSPSLTAPYSSSHSPALEGS